MEQQQRMAEHYKLAEIAARAAAYQLHQRAVRGHGKSPANAAEVVAEAWVSALKKAREADGEVGPDGGPSLDRYLRAVQGLISEIREPSGR